jgi:hypothetical protein
LESTSNIVEVFPNTAFYIGKESVMKSSESEKLLAKAGGTGGLVQELRRASVKSRLNLRFHNSRF